MPITTRVKQPALDALKERRITAPGLAFAIKSTDARVRHILYGYVYPTVDEMYAVASFLDMKIEDLFTDEFRSTAFARAARRKTGTDET